MGWLANMNAKQTREVIESAYQTQLARFERIEGVGKIANALLAVLMLRQSTSVLLQPSGYEGIDILPFSYLGEREAGRTFSEYILFQEFPNDADHGFVRESVRQGISNCLDDDSEWAARNHALLLAKMDEILDLLVWPQWLDENLIERIYDRGQEAIDRLGLAN